MNGQNWESGGLTNDDIIPDPDSDLTAMWSQSDQSACNDCGLQTAIMAYQASNDEIRVMNVTGSSTGRSHLKADAAHGTGLALQSVWHREGSPGLRIYYQSGANDLMSIDYEDSEYGAQASGKCHSQPRNVRCINEPFHQATPLGNGICTKILL